MWESEYNKFIAEPSTFANKEISEFWNSVLSVGESTTQLQGTIQATSQQMDRIQNEVTSIWSDLKEQMDRVVQEAKTELRTELVAMLNQKVVLLEARVGVKVNEVRQDTTSLLKELKTTVAAVRESQEKMGQAMERMSNELQELGQRDDGTDGEEETDPLPSITNWDEDLPTPSATSLWEQPLHSTPSPWLARIPESEEEKASLKDFVTSGQPARKHGEGVEASGLTGRQAIPEFKFGGSFMASDGSIEEMGKIALMPQREEKGELSMGPMVMSGWKSKDYSVPIEEPVSMVGKSTGILEITLGGFAPQIAGVGQMKLEAPP